MTKKEEKPAAAFPEPSKADIVEAKAQGIKEAIAESTKNAYLSGAAEGYGDSDGNVRVFGGTRDVMQLLHLLDGSAEALKERVGEKSEIPLSEGKIAGLLEAERSGKNRTEYVKVLCERLKVSSPYEVTDAGPAFTHDTSNVSALKKPGEK